MKWLIVMLIVGISVSAMALPNLPVDGSGQKIQGFAPDGKKSGALTVNSVIKNGYIKAQIYSPTACKFRLQSTATKVGAQYTLPANANTELTYNPSTPFMNLTGCTNGEWKQQ